MVEITIVGTELNMGYYLHIANDPEEMLCELSFMGWGYFTKENIIEIVKFIKYKYNAVLWIKSQNKTLKNLCKLVLANNVTIKDSTGLFING